MIREDAQAPLVLGSRGFWQHSRHALSTVNMTGTHCQNMLESALEKL